MDIQVLKEGLSIAANAIGVLKSAKNLLPKGEDRVEAERLLNEAETKMKEAEARLAKELGFPVCERCWPPEVMTRNNGGEYTCRCCGKPQHQEAPPAIIPENPMFGDVGNW